MCELSQWSQSSGIREIKCQFAGDWLLGQEPLLDDLGVLERKVVGCVFEELADVIATVGGDSAEGCCRVGVVVRSVGPRRLGQPRRRDPYDSEQPSG